MDGSDKKLCEGNVLNNFKTFSFRTDERSTGAPQEVQYCQVIDILILSLITTEKIVLSDLSFYPKSKSVQKQNILPCKRFSIVKLLIFCTESINRKKILLSDPYQNSKSVKKQNIFT